MANLIKSISTKIARRSARPVTYRPVYAGNTYNYWTQE